MKNRHTVRQGLTVAIILLFIGVALAPSINAKMNNEPIPDLDCEGDLYWVDIIPGATIEGSFSVENIGDPASELDWEIINWPDWGIWTFDPIGGIILHPEDGELIVEVEIQLPEEIEEDLWGEVVIINLENESDICVIHAQIKKSISSNELVEFGVEFCGLGKKHTVKLTQQEADEVEQLFDDIEQRLSEVETRDEAEVIFKEAVVELDKYSLLGGLSVKQAQQLIVGNKVRKNLIKILDSSYQSKSFDEGENSLCLVTGYLTNLIHGGFLGDIYILLGENGVLRELYDNYPLVLLAIMILVLGNSILATILPFNFASLVFIGHISHDFFSNQVSYSPSVGRLVTLGLNGFQSWKGQLWGCASIPVFIKIQFVNNWFYSGILGYTGVKLTNDNYETYFLGFALKVGVTNQKPIP